VRRTLAIVMALAGANAISAPVIHAQSLTREVELTAGQSTDRTAAGAVQVRFFGPLKADWRINLEGSWAGVTNEVSTAFGGTFPYDGRMWPMEAYAEKMFRPAGRLLGVRLGRYRTPFGISSRSDHAYSGFTRAPLIRYGGNFALSNTSFETGANILVGMPALSVETSLGMPLDSGEDRRPRTFDTVVRVQAAYRSFIVGASYLNTRTHPMGDFVRGRMIFRGVDGRWMRGGVQLRGEWIDGRSFDDVATRGGYLDALVHVRAMGPVTAVARIEKLDYDAGRFSFYDKRYVVGARIGVARFTFVQFNLLHQPGGLPTGRTVALDASITRTVRF
jgi:hypothetical protein